MKNFIVLGDSVMKGVIYSKEHQKYKLCKENNFEFLNDYDYNLINKSKMGATVNYCKKTLEKNPEMFNGSTVLLSFGGNDCNFDWKSVSERPDEEHSPVVTPNEFVSTYKDCIHSMQKAGANVLVTNLVPIDSENYFKWLSRGLNPQNILKWLR